MSVHILVGGLVADRLGRDAVLIEINPNYADMAAARISGAGAERPEVA
jgi:DNA modification methylase|tara:strand:- start:466 stop:609 length:144 start_codon:yes stop_codon:yes gene_type:complete